MAGNQRLFLAAAADTRDTVQAQLVSLAGSKLDRFDLPDAERAAMAVSAAA